MQGSTESSLLLELGPKTSIISGPLRLGDLARENSQALLHPTPIQLAQSHNQGVRPFGDRIF
jgi:hypothetical protein